MLVKNRMGVEKSRCRGRSMISSYQKEDQNLRIGAVCQQNLEADAVESHEIEDEGCISCVH